MISTLSYSKMQHSLVGQDHLTTKEHNNGEHSYCKNDSPWRPCWQPPGPPLAPGQMSVQQWRPWWPGPSVSWAHLRKALADLCIYWHTPSSRLWSGIGSWVTGTCAPTTWTRSHSASPPGWHCPLCSSASTQWTDPGTPLSSAYTVSRMSVWTYCWEISQNCPAAPRKTLDGWMVWGREERGKKEHTAGSLCRLLQYRMSIV